MKIAIRNEDANKTATDELRDALFVVDNNYDFDDNGTQEVHNIYHILAMWKTYKKIDYKIFRAILAYYAALIGFDNLNEFEKKLASEHFVVTQENRNQVHTLAEQIENGKNFNRLSSECRANRFDKVKMEVYNRLSKEDVQVIINDVVNERLDIKYIEFGIEGTDSGDVEGIYDYIKSQGSYTLNGISQKNCQTADGMSMSDLANRILGILQGTVI